MKISVITVCLNSAATLEATIQSVLSQKYTDVELEYILIDGGSTDQTLEIIDKYKDRIALVVSGPDKGIYDAMNKGIRLATGDVVGILNSDDVYMDNQVLQKVADSFKMKETDACYGDLLYCDPAVANRMVRFWPAGRYRQAKLRRGWIPPHPTVFVRRQVYEKYGNFDISFRIAADYEFLLRLFLKGNIQFHYIPEVLVVMRPGGYSARDFRQRIRGWKELYRAWRTNGLRPPLFLIITRPLFKLSQYFI